MDIIKTLEERLRKAHSSERPNILNGAYRQLTVSPKGKRADGVIRRATKIFSPSLDLINYLSAELEKSGMANHATRLRKQSPLWISNEITKFVENDKSDYQETSVNQIEELIGNSELKPQRKASMFSTAAKKYQAHTINDRHFMARSADVNLEIDPLDLRARRTVVYALANSEYVEGYDKTTTPARPRLPKEKQTVCYAQDYLQRFEDVMEVVQACDESGVAYLSKGEQANCISFRQEQGKPVYYTLGAMLDVKAAELRLEEAVLSEDESKIGKFAQNLGHTVTTKHYAANLGTDDAVYEKLVEFIDQTKPEHIAIVKDGIMTGITESSRRREGISPLSKETLDDLNNRIDAYQKTN